jgi:hypothetical protein
MVGVDDHGRDSLPRQILKLAFEKRPSADVNQDLGDPLAE